MDKEQDSTISCPQETQFTSKNIHRLKVKAWKVIFQTNGIQGTAGVPLFISDKRDFKTKTIRIVQEDDNIMTKESIH